MIVIESLLLTRREKHVFALNISRGLGSLHWLSVLVPAYGRPTELRSGLGGYPQVYMCDNISMYN